MDMQDNDESQGDVQEGLDSVDEGEVDDDGVDFRMQHDYLLVKTVFADPFELLDTKNQTLSQIATDIIGTIFDARLEELIPHLGLREVCCISQSILRQNHFRLLSSHQVENLEDVCKTFAGARSTDNDLNFIHQ